MIQIIYQVDIAYISSSSNTLTYPTYGHVIIRNEIEETHL